MSSPGLKVPERHSDTEEATGSNPVRPTRFFEILSSAESRDGSQAPAVLRNKRWSRRWHSGLYTRRPGGFGQLEAHSRGCHRVRQPCSIPDVTYGQRGTTRAYRCRLGARGLFGFNPCAWRPYRRFRREAAPSSEGCDWPALMRYGAEFGACDMSVHP